MKNTIPILLLLSLLAGACRDLGEEPDAYGNFEVDEIMISAEIPGKLLSFLAVEGSRLAPGAVAAQIDTTDLIWKREQLRARRKAVAANTPGVLAEIAVLEEQAISIRRELNRTASLLKQGAAPQRQYDELDSQLKVVEKKMAAIRTRNAGILSEVDVIDAQLGELESNIAKCRVVNPVDGIVLVTYAGEHEMTAAGRPLYKIARLDELFLRAYISGRQLSEVAIGDKVTVQYDGADGDIRSLPGVVTWISSEAEFTPKVIQTREDRVSMVYAIKVRVTNDGSLKIGMPGELVFRVKAEEE